MRRFRFIVLLLSLCFLTTSGFAAESRTAVGPETLRSAWADTLARSFRGFLRSLWGADGCGLDPLGRCATQPTTDNGCRLDPLGRCATQPTNDSGCILDPLGRCK